MALQTLVKISGVTTLSDARYCAGMGVEMLGFSMDTDAPDYVDPARFAEIRGWVAGVQIVGETRATDPAHIQTLLDTYQPDLLQLDADSIRSQSLSQFTLPIIVRVDITGQSYHQIDRQLSDYQKDYFLLEDRTESPTSLHEDTTRLDALDRLTASYPLLLGAGLTADSVLPLLDVLPMLRGFALAGGPEERPGQRDFGDLMTILETLEVDS
jgi:phosphoribosylanthranilate isomerase